MKINPILREQTLPLFIDMLLPTYNCSIHARLKKVSSGGGGGNMDCWFSLFMIFMHFNTYHEHKILAKISEFTVLLMYDISAENLYLVCVTGTYLARTFYKPRY